MKGHKVYYQLSNKETQNSRFSENITFTPNVTHVQVGMVPEDWDLEQIFAHFNWMTEERDGLCPKGFTARLKATEGLHHSSMSVGDVVVKADGKVFVCAGIGWKELAHISDSFLEQWR